MTRVSLIFALFCLFFFTATQVSSQVFSSAINLLDSTQQHLLVTKRGDRIVGKILKIEGTTVFLTMKTGNIVSFAFQEIEWVGLRDEKRTESKRYRGYETEIPRLRVDPDRNGSENLLTSASAFNYEKGKGEYRNIDIFINLVDVGLSDHFSVGAGLVLPFAFVVRFKATIDYNEILHFGAGTNNFIPFSEELAGEPSTHLYGVVTLGRPKAYLNATFGYGFEWGGPSLDFPGHTETVPLVASFGGSILVKDRFRFILDVTYLKSSGSQIILPSFTMGWVGRKSRFELGLVPVIDTDSFAIPVAAYSIRF